MVRSSPRESVTTKLVPWFTFPCPGTRLEVVTEPTRNSRSSYCNPKDSVELSDPGRQFQMLFRFQLKYWLTALPSTATPGWFAVAWKKRSLGAWIRFFCSKKSAPAAPTIRRDERSLDMAFQFRVAPPVNRYACSSFRPSASVCSGLDSGTPLPSGLGNVPFSLA